MKKIKQYLSLSVSALILASSAGCTAQGSISLSDLVGTPDASNNNGNSGTSGTSGSSTDNGSTTGTSSGNSSTGSTSENTGSSTGTGSSSTSPGTGLTEEGTPENLEKPLTVANSSDFDKTKAVTEYFKIVGTPGSDDMLATISAGKDGTIFFAGHHTQVLDGFSNDLFVGAMSPDGNLKWMKTFNGSFHQQFKDPGQNAQAGGTQHSMVVGPDGFVYLTAQASPFSTNNFFYSLVAKLDPNTGEAVWSKLWNPSPDLETAKTNAQSYGLDVDGDKVYVTGSTGSNTDQAEAHVMLVAFNTSDGSTAYQKSFDVNDGTNDRGYALKLDGKGGAYIGGSGNGRSFLTHVKGISSNPVISWNKQASTGIGSNINAIDVDNDGNAYLSLDRRGATTYFSAAKVDMNGELVWAKTYSGNGSDRNNTHSIRVFGDHVYVGGRTAQPNFDAGGDGLVLRLKKSDGSMDWATFLFSGTAPDVAAEHRVKNVVLIGNDLYVAGQVYTGNFQGSKYDGRWINGRNLLEDYTATLLFSELPLTAPKDLPNSKLQGSELVGKWVTSPKVIVFQNAKDKNNGAPPDADGFITKLKLK